MKLENHMTHPAIKHDIFQFNRSLKSLRPLGLEGVTSVVDWAGQMGVNSC